MLDFCQTRACHLIFIPNTMGINLIQMTNVYNRDTGKGDKLSKICLTSSRGYQYWR
jgi:hypothetical protein